MLCDKACCDGTDRLLCGARARGPGLLTGRLGGLCLCRGTRRPQPLVAPAGRGQGFLLTTQPRGNWCGVFLDDRTALQKRTGGAWEVGICRGTEPGASRPPGGVTLPTPAAPSAPGPLLATLTGSQSRPRCSWTCACPLCSQRGVRVAGLVPVSYLENDCPCGVAFARVVRSLRF